MKIRKFYPSLLKGIKFYLSVSQYMSFIMGDIVREIETG